jgi:integrase
VAREYELGRLKGRYVIVWREGERRHRKRLPAAYSRVDAERALADLRAHQADRSKGTYTVAQLWDMYRESLGSRPSAVTMGYEWRALKERFGDLPPHGITEGLCQSHLNARLAAGRTPGTVWTELGRLRMVFAWAKKRRLVDTVSYIPRPAASPPRNLSIRKSEMPALIAACQAPHLRLFCLLAWTTGARDAALLGLTWDRVDFDRGMIDFERPDGRPMKGRSIVPMNGTILAALQEARRGALTDHVIEYAGRPVGSVKKSLKAAGKRAGMPWISPHVFRHSAARAMAEDGISMPEIAAYLGHSNTAMTIKVYARFSPTYLRKAAASLDLNLMGQVQLNLIERSRNDAK